MKKLTHLIESSPYPIKFVKYRGENYDSTYGGCCQYNPPEIFIMPCFRFDYEKFMVIAHEIQHARCYEKGCFCMTNSLRDLAYYREYHAYKAQIQACLGYPKAIKFCVDQLKTTSVGSTNEFSPHRKVIKNLQKTKLWRKAVAEAKKSEIKSRMAK